MSFALTDDDGFLLIDDAYLLLDEDQSVLRLLGQISLSRSIRATAEISRLNAQIGLSGLSAAVAGQITLSGLSERQNRLQGLLGGRAAATAPVTGQSVLSATVARETATASTTSQAAIAEIDNQSVISADTEAAKAIDGSVDTI